MKLSLEIEVNKEVVEKSFSPIRMRGRHYKRMLEIQDVMTEADNNNVYTQEHYVLMCEFICEMYGDKFTVDELLDGIYLEDLYPTFSNLCKHIADKTTMKMESLIKK